MRVVGVAGKCCAGKDLVVKWFSDRGWQEINVDHVGHQALEELQEEILHRFGRTILNDRGDRIDRARLGRLVFSSSSALARLEELVHPWIRQEVSERTRSILGSSPVTTVVINAALLVPLGLHTLCDAVFLVEAPLGVRIARARRRDALGWRAIFRRLWAQRRLHIQARRSCADIIRVDNRSAPELLYRQLEEALQLRQEPGE
ncbi:dephospho-CoA kinase [Alkalispirochaeta americana]|uniref:Dephospho-CoA kinase n=1 Tax=Alkalispirochaeta americana TaxID=159291 RepID=A0A1N6TDN0_9SPIO|nr:dephospho-CoA kinase [Alkalispirochaeta americana]SIQ51482.1 dephospho-CoA kinase [Alkalispirochaeta americana]